MFVMSVISARWTGGRARCGLGAPTGAGAGVHSGVEPVVRLPGSGGAERPSTPEVPGPPGSGNRVGAASRPGIPVGNTAAGRGNSCSDSRSPEDRSRPVDNGARLARAPSSEPSSGAPRRGPPFSGGWSKQEYCCGDHYFGGTRDRNLVFPMFVGEDLLRLQPPNNSCGARRRRDGVAVLFRPEKSGLSKLGRTKCVLESALFPL